MDTIMQIKDKINREYFEYYAKYSLAMSVDEKYRYLKKHESPDWQSSFLDVGVEVTRAIDTDIYLAYNIINEYFGNVFFHSHVDKKIIKIKENYSNLIDLTDRDITRYNDSLNVDNLRKRYIYKTNKLNKNYIRYQNNQLYMFTFKSMDEAEVNQCFDVDLSQYPVNFNICYINCFDRLYVCDFIQKEIRKIIYVDKNILHLTKKRALKKSKLK